MGSAAAALPRSAVSVGQAQEVLDCRGLHVLPGVIDTQVHFREPGLEHKEDLESGSRAAVMGGVTAVFEMPNTRPLTTDAATLAEKVRRARHRMFCDFAFFVGGTRENVDDLPKLERLEGSAGIKGSCRFLHAICSSRMKARSTASSGASAAARRFPRRGRGAPQGAARVAPRGRSCLPSRVARRGGRADRHAPSRRSWPRSTASVHVLHVSTAAEMAYLAALRDWASVEVTPHHLTLAAPDCYAELGTYAQMNPPFATSATVARCGPGSRAASSTYWVPTMPRTRARRRSTPTPTRTPA